MLIQIKEEAKIMDFYIKAKYIISCFLHKKGIQHY